MNYETIAEVYKQKLKQMQESPTTITYQVVTIGDKEICTHCKEFFKGYKCDVSEAIVSVNHPPFHEDCRCLVTYSVEGIRK